MLIRPDQIKHLVQKIVEVSSPQKVILFGSYATGHITPDSDLDVLVIKESLEPRFKRTREIRKSLRGSKIPLDILMYTPSEIKEWENVKTVFITRVLREGKVVYER